MVYGIQRSTEYLSRLSPPPKYCTVSYVWGETKDIDVESVDWKVPITSEEKLHFMLDACARQGFTYVWCDLLCIRQGSADRDPRVKEDQHVELVKMQQYYANSSATIVLGQHYKTFASRWSKVAPVLRIWAADRAATKSETLRAVWDCLGDIDSVIHDSHESWFWRVWTLQEAVVPRQATLMTTDGTEMNLPLFCDLIDWTYSALGTETLNTNCGNKRYDWIHPGQGVVNDRGWWVVSDNLKAAMSFRNSPMHPMQLLNITRFRRCFRPVDRLRGAYAMIDKAWQVDPDEAERQADAESNGMSRDEKERRLFEITWEKTVDKYIERDNPDLAPLLTMRIRDTPRRTWGIGEVQLQSWAETHLVGTVTAEFGKWINRTGKCCCLISPRKSSVHPPLRFLATYISSSSLATLVHEGRFKGSLRLRASGIDQIQQVHHNYGELSKMLAMLASVVKKHNVSSTLALLIRVTELSQQRHAGGPRTDHASLEAAQSALRSGAAPEAMTGLK